MGWRELREGYLHRLRPIGGSRQALRVESVASCCTGICNEVEG